MKYIKVALLLVVLSTSAFGAIHKFYVSVTQVAYVKDQHAVQIICRVFIDDLEGILRAKYDPEITLDAADEPPSINGFIDTYFNEKLKIKINGKAANIVFLGKTYEADIVKCYLEITEVQSVQSFEISNHVLFDFKSEQQNIIKTKINSKEKSVIQTLDKGSTLLKFN